MLLGAIPLKLDRQHEKAWVLLVTFPTCTQLVYSLQSHYRLTQPCVFPVPSPLATSSFPPPSDDIHCQVCQSPFDEHQMPLCDMCNAVVLLGSIPPKLDRQHEKAWVLLTSSTCTQLVYSFQSHSRLTQLPVLPSTSLPATILSSPPPDDIHCQVCHSPFDEHKMLLCDICNAGWHMDCLLPPLTAIPHGTWKCPLCIPRHLLPQTVIRHLRLPSPILNLVV